MARNPANIYEPPMADQVSFDTGATVFPAEDWPYIINGRRIGQGEYDFVESGVGVDVSYGTIFYDDIFGKHHSSNWCIWYEHAALDVGDGQLCENNNESDSSIPAQNPETNCPQ